MHLRLISDRKLCEDCEQLQGVNPDVLFLELSRNVDRVLKGFGQARRGNAILEHRGGGLCQHEMVWISSPAMRKYCISFIGGGDNSFA